MKSKVEKLKQNMETFRQFLQGNRYAVSFEVREQLAKRLNEIELQLKYAEDPLLQIGILGGTGVGKSTLINALAGNEISTVSHRRPYTDFVIVYRHKDVSVPDGFPRHCLKEPHIAHTNSLISKLIIYDFPDFDSIVESHREKVFAMLKHIDVAVWVVSIEKYGDFEFYNTLEKTTKHQDNFLFVLNKIDRVLSSHLRALSGDSPHNASKTEKTGNVTATGTGLREEIQSDARKEVNRIIGDFAAKLKAHGIAAPRIYAFSAKYVNNSNVPRSWYEDFKNFKDTIFKERTKKETLAIKEANLEAELLKFTRELQTLSLRFQHLPFELNSVLMEFQKDFQQLLHVVPSIVKRFTTTRTYMFAIESARLATNDLFPVRIAKRLIPGKSKNKGLKQETNGWESVIYAEDARLKLIREKFSVLTDRLSIIFQRYSMDHAAEEIYSFNKLLIDELGSFLSEGNEAFNAIVAALSKPAGRFSLWLEKIKQYFWLGIPAMFLVISLLGPETIRRTLLHPSLGKLLVLFFNLFLSIYTPSGLASLAVFLFLEFVVSLLLALKGTNRSEKRIRKELDKFDEIMSENLAKRLEILRAEIERLTSDIAREIKELNTIGDLLRVCST